MAPLGLSGGIQFSSTVLPDGVAVTVSMRGAEGSGGWQWTNVRRYTYGRGKVLTLHTHTGAYLNEGAEKQDTHTHPVQVAIYTTNLNN